MKYILALCLLGVALAAPQRNINFRRDEFQQQQQQQQYNPNNFLRTVRYEVSPFNGANFRYNYETENNIIVEKEGYEGSQGQSNMRGFYRYESPNGEIVEVHYVADEDGYRAESDHIPTPPPMPAHALEQIRIAAEQRAAGIRWDHRGFQI